MGAKQPALNESTVPVFPHRLGPLRRSAPVDADLEPMGEPDGEETRHGACPDANVPTPISRGLRSEMLTGLVVPEPSTQVCLCRYSRTARPKCGKFSVRVTPGASPALIDAKYCVTTCSAC